MTRFARYCCALSLVLSACGGDDHNDPADRTDAGPRFDAEPRPDAGPPINTDGPVVEIVNPIEPPEGEYPGDVIVVNGSLEAVCRVSVNPETETPVDSASVTISAAGDGETVEVAATATGISDAYVATLDVSGLGNGELTITCKAADLAATPRANSATVDTFLDLGPEVEVFSPTAGSSYGQQVDLTFTVTEAPVADDDDGAALDTVVVTVAGVEMTPEDTGGGSYFLTIDFDSAEFNPALEGDVEVQILATNTRAVVPVTRDARVTFDADASGPVIDIATPEPGELIGGFITIAASVDDPAGVQSVVATVAHLYEVTLTGSGGSYSGTFDTRVLPTHFVFPLIEVRATDVSGNESSVGRVVAVDNVSPLVSLDSPNVREALCLTGSIYCEDEDPRTCSLAFDPLGTDAVNDGQMVTALSELRVRAEDVGNGGNSSSGVFLPRAEVDDDSVEFYVLDDASLALLVDIDGDGMCDEINPDLVPTTVPDAANEAAVVSLVSVAGGGGAYFGADNGPYGEDPFMNDAFCSNPAEPDEDLPSAICASSPLYSIISAFPSGDAAIFGIPPLTSLNCLGNAWDAPASNISDGWACVAARATDRLGNVGVSPPLRMCIDWDQDGLDANGEDLGVQGCGLDGDLSPGTIADEANRPLCTDGCAIPFSFTDYPAFQIRDVGVGDPPCNDGIDNDEDTLTDLDDPECNSDPFDLSESE
jgi:hypothetical protein